MLLVDHVGKFLVQEIVVFMGQLMWSMLKGSREMALGPWRHLHFYGGTQS